MKIVHDSCKHFSGNFNKLKHVLIHEKKFMYLLPYNFSDFALWGLVWKVAVVDGACW